MSEPATMHKRVFLVGCSRSGTTLLQVLLAGHPRIYSFPETGFFIHAVGIRRRPLAFLGVTTRKGSWAVGQFLERVGREDLKQFIPEQWWSLAKVTDAFIKILDLLTLQAGMDIWLEKTPRHVFYVDFIQKYVDSGHVIHLIRKGQDVVASIYDRAVRFPEKFHGQRDLNYGIRLWNRAIETSLRYAGHSGHSFVLYDQLVREPDIVLNRVCNDLGIAYDARMKEISKSAGDVVLAHEKWKNGVSEVLHPVRSKFETLFDLEARALISRRLKLDAYERLQAMVGQGAS